MESIPRLKIERDYVPGIIGRIAELHGLYYSEHWGFDLYFEAKVATELSEFLIRYHTHQDGLWIARVDGRVEGSIVIDGIRAQDEGAHLRWFILSDTLRGKGVGKSLMNEAVAFCKSKAYKKVHLWTFEGLDAARHLYESAGFKMMKQRRGVQWGTEVNEQYFELVNE